MEIKARELRHTKTVEFSLNDTYAYGEPKAYLLYDAARFLVEKGAVLIGLEFDRNPDDETVTLFLTYE